MTTALPHRFVRAFSASRNDVTLHAVQREGPEMLVAIAIGARPPLSYRLSVDADDPEMRAVAFEESLFFELSDLAATRYANATRYQLELAAIVRAFAKGQSLPPLPARLGETRMAMPLTLGRLVRDHVRRRASLLQLVLLRGVRWARRDRGAAV